ncbi:DUF222 domain-containing protein [Microbacterium sp.]|uniref:DUF222 domain-containing protein n=1 Tax=Microbacterium sp. TaxID=51671 RepID=UPI0039E33870
MRQIPLFPLDTANISSIDALVTAVVDARRQIAALQAREAKLMAEAVDLAIARMERRPAQRSTGRDLPLREIAAELGAATRVPDRTVQVRMGEATSLVERFPATLARFEAGDLDSGHVRVIVEAGRVIDDADVRAEYESRVLDAASSESPNRLRSLARASSRSARMSARCCSPARRPRTARATRSPRSPATCTSRCRCSPSPGSATSRRC